MSKIALIYSFNTSNTKRIAEIIKEKYGSDKIEDVNAEELTEEKFLSYDKFIIGSPTWFDGELPNYWDEFIPALEELDLKNKTFALFGLGDQVNYPENFLDAIGILAEIFEQQGGKVVGYFSADGFSFESSKALKDDKFCGLPIDIENQSEKIEDNVNKWVSELKKIL